MSSPSPYFPAFVVACTGVFATLSLVVYFASLVLSVIADFLTTDSREWTSW